MGSGWLVASRFVAIIHENVKELSFWIFFHIRFFFFFLEYILIKVFIFLFCLYLDNFFFHTYLGNGLVQSVHI